MVAVGGGEERGYGGGGGGGKGAQTLSSGTVTVEGGEFPRFASD